MSVSIRFSGGGIETTEFHLASGRGWTDFRTWVNKLPSKMVTLRRLVTVGEVKNTFRLSNDLREALDSLPPSNKDVLDVAEHLVKHVGAGDESEVAEVII